jgi:uncharacterized glyoxalase superfamily protein PhnB
MTQKIKTFLMFEGNCEQAMNFYVSLFRDAAVTSIRRYGPEGPGAEGSVTQATFAIAGQTFMCIDSPVKHNFTFTPQCRCSSIAPTKPNSTRCLPNYPKAGRYSCRSTIMVSAASSVGLPINSAFHGSSICRTASRTEASRNRSDRELPHFVTTRRVGATVLVGAIGESENVSHVFHPAGRLAASNSP